jgi:pimeloyl-ACP methyl ester carboxylesterase
MMRLEMIGRYPPNGTRPTPLLFVHGALHGAWCWDVHFLDYFAQRGFASHAVNLRGHGNSEGREKLRWIRIADYVNDLADAVQKLPSPPVLIGHSLGGFVIQKYLERHTSAGAVLLSSPSPSGLLPLALRKSRQHPLILAKVTLTMSLYPLVATPGLAREAFFSDDVPDEQLQEYWEQMQDDSFMAFLDMIALDLPKPAKIKTPLLILGAERDNMLKRSEIEATARAYHTQYEIIADVAHNSMLELRWQAVAERILIWLNERI